MAEHSVVLAGDRSAQEEDVLKELFILKQLAHPNILHLHEYYLGAARDKVYIVTELLRGGELLDALLERGSYSERDARTIFKSILSGIEYLHTRRITHRDLKLENLLLANKADLSSVKLADFGMAKAAFSPNEDPNRMALVCGTPAYIAPEVVTGRRYTNAVDMWSAGVILFILLSGVVPFDDPDEHALLVKIARGAYSVNGREWVWVSDSAKSLVTALMHMSPSARLSAAGAMAHPWMTRGEAATPSTALAGAQGGLRTFAERAKLPVRAYAAGATIFQQGDAATEVLLIRRGRCDIVLDDALGVGGGNGMTRTIATRGPGEFIGELGLLLDPMGQLVLPPAAATDADPGADAGTDDTMTAAASVVATGAALEGGTFAGRRTATVRAVEHMEVLVLPAKRLHWVLAHDTSVRAELVAAVEQRQRELRAARAASPPAAQAGDQWRRNPASRAASA